jgi:hypothetical protein
VNLDEFSGSLGSPVLPILSRVSSRPYSLLEIAVLGESASAHGSSLRSICISLSIEIITTRSFRDYAALWNFLSGLGSKVLVLSEPGFENGNRFAFPRSSRVVWFGAAWF